MKKIIVFGGSIARGAWDKEIGGRVNRLRLFLEQNNYDTLLYNQSVSGDTTDDLLERMDVECRYRCKFGRPELILFAIGLNDSQYINNKENPVVTLDDFGKNLSKLLDIAKQYTDKIVFVGLTKVDEPKTIPIPWQPEKNYDNENVMIYDDRIKSFCDNNNIYYTSLFDLLKDGDLKDGRHPNSRGHKKIFDKVKDFLVDNKLI